MKIEYYISETYETHFRSQETKSLMEFKINVAFIIY